jgi:hypothetical protein
MTLEEWTENARRETRGDMVWDILWDWALDRASMRIRIEELMLHQQGEDNAKPIP